jgi:hypothetical protein
VRWEFFPEQRRRSPDGIASKCCIGAAVRLELRPMGGEKRAPAEESRLQHPQGINANDNGIDVI